MANQVSSSAATFLGRARGLAGDELEVVAERDLDPGGADLCTRLVPAQAPLGSSVSQPPSPIRYGVVAGRSAAQICATSAGRVVILGRFGHFPDQQRQLEAVDRDLTEQGRM
jgi:hypothetical protein